jgi:hypothetical protein
MGATVSRRMARGKARVSGRVNTETAGSADSPAETPAVAPTARPKLTFVRLPPGEGPPPEFGPGLQLLLLRIESRKGVPDSVREWAAGLLDGEWAGQVGDGPIVSGSGRWPGFRTLGEAGATLAERKANQGIKSKRKAR